MAKAGKWLRTLLTGKKDKEDPPPPRGIDPAPTPSPPSKEKKRWSFRRSTGHSKDHNSTPTKAAHGTELDPKKRAKVVAAATDAAVAAAQAAAVVIRLTAAVGGRPSAIEAVAAVKIQTMYRSYLARKALKALKGLVKLQALIRGHLVRKQATATLRCMQAMVAAQTRARTQRIRMVEEAMLNHQRLSLHRGSPSPQDPRFRRGQEMDRSMEDKVKIVEMDIGESRGASRGRISYSASRVERQDHRYSSCCTGPDQHCSPPPSTITDMSPRTCSGHYDEFSFLTAQTSPHYFTAISRLSHVNNSTSTANQEEEGYSISNDGGFFPNYMANTESSRAKARSQSAPKQRPDTCERPLVKRRPPTEHRNVPRGIRMLRSSSHTGQYVNGNHYPWPVKLDKSSASLKDSECGSTSTVFSNPNHCRSLVPYEATTSRY